MMRLLFVVSLCLAACGAPALEGDRAWVEDQIHKFASAAPEGGPFSTSQTRELMSTMDSVKDQRDLVQNLRRLVASRGRLTSNEQLLSCYVLSGISSDSQSIELLIDLILDEKLPLKLRENVRRFVEDDTVLTEAQKGRLAKFVSSADGENGPSK